MTVLKNAIIDPMLSTLYKVDEVTIENKDTFTVCLRAVEDPNKPFVFLPGQFNMLYVYGIGEIPISISGNPINNQTLRHTTRVVGVVTKALGKLKKGDMIGVRGPYGTSWPIESAYGKDAVLVAGGIGLAPLRPVVYTLLKNKEKFNQLVLLYGTRDPDDILFKNELKEWSKKGLNIFVTVDRAIKEWSGSVGVVTSIIPGAPFDPDNALAFICGPEVMMHFTVLSLKQRGMREEDLFISMERNMKCAVGFCGHCQYGPYFICKDGPVFNFKKIGPIFRKAEL